MTLGSAPLSRESLLLDQLPEKFDPESIHHVRLDVSGHFFQVMLDEKKNEIKKTPCQNAHEISISVKNAKAEIVYFALTNGFEDLFERSDTNAVDNGFIVAHGTATLSIENKQLTIANHNEGDTIVIKGGTVKNFEFVSNVRLIETFAKNASFGFSIMTRDREPTRRFDILSTGEEYCLSDSMGGNKMALGKEYRSEEYRQFRFVRIGTSLRIESEDRFLGETAVDGSELLFGISCRNCSIGLDMVRCTEI